MQRLNTNMTPDSRCLRFGCKYMLINAFSFGIVLTYSYLCNHNCSASPITYVTENYNNYEKN